MCSWQRRGPRTVSAHVYSKVSTNPCALSGNKDWGGFKDCISLRLTIRLPRVDVWWVEQRVHAIPRISQPNKINFIRGESFQFIVLNLVCIFRTRLSAYRFCFAAVIYSSTLLFYFKSLRLVFPYYCHHHQFSIWRLGILTILMNWPFALCYRLHSFGAN